MVENADYGTDSSDFDTEESSSESESEVRYTVLEGFLKGRDL